MRLHEKILYYRRAARLSQEELAARVGVSRQAVSKWELGEATPEVGKLLALAREFGVTTDELLSEEEPAASPDCSEGWEEPPPPAAPAENNFDRATGLIGRLIQKYGWLFGVRVALGGLGLTVIGALARWGFGAFFDTAAQMTGGMGGFGGYMEIDGMVISPSGFTSEVEQALLDQMGLAPATPFGGVEGFFLGFATVILVLGILTTLAGGALALWLYKKGNGGR